MKMFKIIAITATLMVGASAAYANPFSATGGFESLNAIDNASYATVLKVEQGAAEYLSFENDVGSVQQRLKNNPYLARTIAQQGFSIDDVVGVTGTDTDLTIYAL